MKTKILNALKTEYANLGLGDKAFDGVASFLETTITDESKISEEIKKDLVKNLLKSIQGESDALRNRNTQLQRDFDAYKLAHPEDNGNGGGQGGNGGNGGGNGGQETEPEWARKLREKMEAREAQEAAQGLEQRLRERFEAEKLNNKGFLYAVFKGFALQQDETEDAAFERLKAEYNTIAKDTLGNGVIPPTGAGAPSSEGYKPGAFANYRKSLEQRGVVEPQQTK